MKPAILIAAAVLAASPGAAFAGPQEDAIMSLIKAVKRGDDLSTAFPGAVSAAEIASLQRVARCDALNLMKQAKGRYTVVWDCGAKGAVGMKVLVSHNKVTSVSTAQLVRR
jgi:hypothetical protein